MKAFNQKFDANLHKGDIGKYPATALYDFCNAFPTLVHEWMFLVIKAYKFPRRLQNAILNLYTSIFAYTAGCGDGSFLLEVLCGVKTGCPLSSLFFLLCVNPIIY